MSGEHTGNPDRRGLKRFLPRDAWQVLIGPLIVVIVGAVITTLVTGSEEEPQPTPNSKRAVLEALPPVVQNGPFEGRSVQLPSGETATGHDNASKPRVEIRVHNTGTRRAVLTSARFTVTDFVRIVPCGLGAGLVASARYDVVLPVKPRRGETVEVPINQQLGPDEADRFVFRLGVDDLEKILGLIDVYELHVTVAHDNEPEPVDVGRVVVVLPGAPEPFAIEFFPVPGATTCSRAPSKAARRALTFEGTRSPEVEQAFAHIRRRL
jgi:hypothetical protein